MQSKYFTPLIEDIFPGYECEKHVVTDFSRNISHGSPESYEHYVLNDKEGWEKYILTKEDCIALLSHTGDLRTSPGIPLLGFFKTPFLTKEQIEAEGWVEDTTESFTKGMLIKKEQSGRILYCRFYPKTNNLYISQFVPSEPNNVWSQSMRSTLFDGFCKDINTFHKLLILLNIK